MRKKSNNGLYAMKYMNKHWLVKYGVRDLEYKLVEVELLRTLHHPHIANLR